MARSAGEPEGPSRRGVVFFDSFLLDKQKKGIRSRRERPPQIKTSPKGTQIITFADETAIKFNYRHRRFKLVAVVPNSDDAKPDESA